MAGRDFSVAVNIGGRELPSLAAAVRSAQGRMAAFSNSLTKQVAEQKAAIAGMMASFKGMAAFAAAGGMAFSVKKFLGDGEELAHEIQKLRSAGRTAHEVAEGITAANNSIRKMPTASLTGSIKLLNETTGAFGDYHHALENLDFNSKLASVLKNTSGSEDPEHDIGSLIKALEIRGSASDPAKYRREAGELQRAMTFFGGRLKADEFKTFASNAQTGIRQLNERFLTKIAPSLIQEIGGDKTGTGLTAFRTIISGRKITDKKQAEAWQKLGLLNGKGIIRNKMGDVTGWKEGSVKGTALAYKDPLQYMESVILPRLKKQGTDITDPIKLGAALNTLFKNTKANAFVTAISTVVDRTRLKKDEALINKVLDLDKNYDDSLLNDPKMARFAIAQAMKNLGSSLTLPLMKPIAQGLISIARAANQLSAALIAHPEAARIVAGLGGALATMAAIRLASFVFGVSSLARAISLLMIAAPIGAAARLIALAKGITALSIAAGVSLAARLRGIALGALMLTRVGGASALVAGLGGALVGLGARIATFPLLLLRGIGFALRGLLVSAAVGTGVGAILAAFVALGLWAKNNWDGLKTFFKSFGESFTKALGPSAAGSVTAIVDAMKSVYDWVSDLLGVVDETGAKWVSWGDQAGKGAALIVTAIADLPAEMGKAISSAYKAVTAINWSGAGKAIVDGIVAGISAGASRIGDAIKGGIAGIGSYITGGTTPAAPASALPKASGPGSLVGMRQRRAMGGPVSAGMPYLVGERGPEIFVPNGNGTIKTNGFLNGLGGGPTVDASAVARTRALAGQTGMALHVNLDAIRKPIVDTSSIDEAAIKVASLGSALGGLGGSIGGGLGGGGGGAGGSWNGNALAIGKGAGIGHTASKEERAAFIQSYAKSIGIDSKTALRVAQSEGFNKYTGDQGRSFGDFQLFTGGGVGNRALRAGINVRDPRQWKAADKYALDVAKREGWAQWHGARRVGIGNWHGITRARATGGPVGGGLPYLVGERGPEIFTPGESGRIASNREIARLTDPAAVARLRSGGAGVSVSHSRGDSHYSPSFTIHGGGDVARIKREVEGHFWDMVRQAERDQAGSLSD